MPSRERKKYNTTKHIPTHIFESKFSYIMFYISYIMYIPTINNYYHENRTKKSMSDRPGLTGDKFASSKKRPRVELASFCPLIKY